MADFPSLPLFTDAWVADTKHLTRLERGTYHDLLVLMWRSPECRVPNDDAWLGKRLGMTPNEVQNELRPIIAEFIQSDGNWLCQKRLRKEWEWCHKNRKKQSDSAKSRWRNNKKSNVAMPPTPPLLKENIKRKRPAKVASQIPEDWTLTPERLTAAQTEGLMEADAKWEARKFVNYWRSEAKPKKDWEATWRNWCITAASRKPSRAPPVVVNIRSREAIENGFYAKAGSRQLDAWDKHRGKPYPRDKDGGWMVPAEWPPQEEIREAQNGH